MRKHPLLIGALSLVVFGAGTHFVRAEEEDEGTEVKMKFDDVPAAVRDTLTKQAPGVKIDSVDKETSKAGKIIYEADAKLDGKNWEINVDPDGKLISKKIDAEEDEKKPEADEKKGKDKDEDEQTITADQLPAAVKTTLDKETSGGTIGKLEKESEDGKTLYKATATVDGKDWKFKIRDDGQLLKKELKEKKDDDEKNEKK